MLNIPHGSGLAGLSATAMRQTFRVESQMKCCIVPRRLRPHGCCLAVPAAGSVGILLTMRRLQYASRVASTRISYGLPVLQQDFNALGPMLVPVTLASVPVMLNHNLHLGQQMPAAHPAAYPAAQPAAHPAAQPVITVQEPAGSYTDMYG